jgi:hypothetical protein
MSCCGAEVIVTNSGGGGTTDTYSYLFSTIGISTLGLVQSNVNTGALSNLSEWNSPYNYISTSANLQAINLYSSNANGTSNLASVNVPYGVSGTPYQFSIYPSVPNDANQNRLMYQTYYNTDSNPIRTLTFSNIFVTAPMVNVTPYSQSGGILVPHITSITNQTMNFGLYDITTSNYTADPAWIHAIGQYTDIQTFSNVTNITSVYYPGYFNSNLWTFTTPGDLDESVPVEVTYGATITFNMNPGGEFGSYFVESNAAQALPFQTSVFYCPLYPSALFGNFSYSNVSTVNLKANTTYYGFGIVSYAGSAMFALSNDITLKYNSYI